MIIILFAYYFISKCHIAPSGQDWYKCILTLLQESEKTVLGQAHILWHFPGKTGTSATCRFPGKTGISETCEFTGKTGLSAACEFAGNTGISASCELPGNTGISDFCKMFCKFCRSGIHCISYHVSILYFQKKASSINSNLNNECDSNLKLTMH